MSSREPPSQTRRLITDLWQLLLAWWRVDRIRASPREGFWLRLEPGDGFLLDNHWWEITSRVVDESTSPPTLRYSCRDGDDRGSLRLSLSSENPRLRWIHADREVLLDPDEIQMVRPHSG